MEEETKGGYIEFAKLSEEQKEEALALRPIWGENVLFWVDEEGHISKCSMTTKKRKHEDKDSIHKI